MAHAVPDNMVTPAEVQSNRLRGTANMSGYVGCKERTAQGLLDDGVIPSFKASGVWFASVATLDAWLSALYEEMLRLAFRSGGRA